MKRFKRGELVRRARNLFIGAITMMLITPLCMHKNIPDPQLNEIEVNNSKQLTDTLEDKDTLITIVGVGDIMLGTDYPNTSYLPPNKECSGLMKGIVSYLLEADITFGNVEGVFAGEKGKAKGCNDPTTCYVFRMPERYVECLVDADFDLLSVANNHVYDFGYEGTLNSARVLTEAGLNFAGFESKPSITIEKNGIKYGFCAFAPHTGTADFRKLNEACAIVKKLNEECDIVIVSFHSGAEGRNNQHVTRQDEIFLGYNRGNVYEFAHKVIDAGADVVFGHGPHVTRAVELYKGRFIAYSLGNFCTYRRFNLSGPNGFAPIIKINIDSSGGFVNGRAIPVYQPGEGGPVYDSLNRAVKKLQELTSEDFPEGKLVIKDDGNILIQ
ncbi:MAG: CapA family protein [Bacteroidales bacterium]|nr:CapA family protein [Bacteroidales bacterium]